MITSRGRARARRRPRCDRRGFSLIELMVAIVLLSVGMLALAGSSATVLRSMTTAAMQTRAANLAGSQLDAMRSAGCGQIVHGNRKERGVTLSWTTEAIPRGVIVNMTAVYATGYGMRTSSTRNVIAC